MPVWQTIVSLHLLSHWFWSTGMISSDGDGDGVLNQILSEFIMVCYPIVQDIKILRPTWKNAAVCPGPVPSYNGAFPFQSFLTHFID